jgi:hypothetical protein
MRNQKPALTDFDARYHRCASAAVSLQKGIYHLFMLRRQATTDLYATDLYAKVLRTYQCVFQICLALLLLDFDFSLNPMLKRIPPRLRRLCGNSNEPSREYLDPACVVTHSVFENGHRAWHGFRQEHPLHSVAEDALALYRRIVDARHSLLYRPFLTDEGGRMFWRDCPLRDLIGTTPSADEIEIVYGNFVRAVWDWRAADMKSSVPERFIRDLFMVYEDQGGNRPTETLVLSYARTLNPGDEELLGKLRSYRNGLLRLGDDPRFSKIIWPADSRIGEV